MPKLVGLALNQPRTKIVCAHCKVGKVEKQHAAKK